MFNGASPEIKGALSKTLVETRNFASLHSLLEMSNGASLPKLQTALLLINVRVNILHLYSYVASDFIPQS